MRKYKNIIILLTITNLIFMAIICNIINKNGSIIREKQVIKEMTEGEYESKITELNKSHEDYALQVEENRKKIATAITNQKVTTSEDASIDEMVTNIGKILQTRTSDADATAEDIAEGKTAYVNGEKIIGNANNKSFSPTKIVSKGNSGNTKFYTWTYYDVQNFEKVSLTFYRTGSGAVIGIYYDGEEYSRITTWESPMTYELDLTNVSELSIEIMCNSSSSEEYFVVNSYE